MTSTGARDRGVLRSRLSGAIGAHMPGGIDRLGWDAAGWPPTSATGCGRCWPARPGARHSTPAGSAGSTPAVSSSPTWPGCRS